MQIWVSGIGIVSSIGINVDENFKSLAEGKSGIGSIAYFSSNHALPVGEVKRSNLELQEMLGLDLGKTYSRTTLLGMLAAREALRDAHLVSLPKRTGLISATTVGGMDLTPSFYQKFLKDNGSGRLRYVAGHDCYDSTQKIAQFCGIGYYSTTISTACSSAANAIMLGARLIASGRLDCAVVGGVDSLCKFTLNGFNSLMILDSKPCRPFDDTRAGLNLGEGAGFVVLQRADDVAGEPYCRLAGFANANDAHHQTASSAEGNGAYLAMRNAISEANMSPSDISYINVHGTGTANNDASEGAALKRLFGDDVPPFSSTKAYTGHTLAAAGGIEAVFSALAIRQGVLFPNLNFEVPIAGLGLVPLSDYKTGVRVDAVMSNSFGFGGNDSALIFSKR